MTRLGFIGLGLVVCVGAVCGAFAESGDKNLTPAVGEYTFVTTQTSAEDRLIRVSDPRGEAVVSRLPLSQTASVAVGQKCAGEQCLEIVARREIRPFISGFEGQKFLETIRATIDASTGEVKSLRTELKIGEDVSISTESGFDRGFTVADFFGPWMLDLKDGYSETFKAADQLRQFKVVGRETVRGRPCFVVKKAFSVGGGRQVRTTLWVDVERRVTVKALQGADIMLLDG